MDNHKDFIHIDDLFKDLRGGEEQEPSGAWLRMKDLLDKEMPAGTAVTAGRSFRRYIIPLVAMLLAGGGFTYYKMNQESNVAASALSVPGNTVATHTGSNGTPSGTERNMPIAANMPEREQRQHGTARNHNATQPTATTHSTERSAATSSAASNTIAAATSHNRNAVANKRHAAPTTSVKGRKANGNGAAPETLASHSTGPNADAKVNTAPANREHTIEQIKPANSQTLAANNSSATKRVGGTADKHNNMQPAAANQFGSGNETNRTVTTLGNKKVVQGADGKMYKEQRDTFKRIDVVERAVAANNSGSGTRGMKTKFDTVAITRIEKISYVPLTPLETIAVQKLKVSAGGRAIVPITNLKEKIVSNEMVSLVPLSNYKVASRKVDPGKFNQLMQNTSQGISNYFDGSHNFYAGLLLGGNTSFGNPGAFGMQFGIAAMYQLSERLTLGAEFKYVSHYFSNYSLEDKSISFENVSSAQLSSIDWLFSGDQKTVTNAYRINSFGAFELPVTLNYNLGRRMSVFAGMTMAYAMPIKWSKTNTVNSVRVERNNTENTNPFKSSMPQVNEQVDFASRFGMGYVWGINYDFSRTVSLDARMSHILWDTNQSSTDALRKLFHVPTLQISVAYFFGRKDKVVYIMDRR